MITAVGFDLDYTLAVPERDRQTLLDEATAAADAPPIDREEYIDAHRRNLTSRTREPAFDELLSDADAEPGAVAAAYREAVEGALVPVEGAAGLVCGLRERYRVGLLTDGPVLAQRGKLAALGWEDLFDAVVVTGALPAGKPDPRPFGALLEALGADAGATVYVGDAPELDVRGAADAGLLAVQVVYPDGPDPDPRADVHVARDELADRLPEVVAAFD